MPPISCTLRGPGVAYPGAINNAQMGMGARCDLPTPGSRDGWRHSPPTDERAARLDEVTTHKRYMAGVGMGAARHAGNALPRHGAQAGSGNPR